MLRKKCGSASTDKEFKRLVTTICEEDAAHSHIPDYAITMEGQNVRFTNRHTMKTAVALETYAVPVLDAETYHDARTVAPGYDVRFLEQEWQNWWCESGRPVLQDPDKAFIAFCRRRYERNPNP